MNRDAVMLEKLDKELRLKELQIKSLLTITQAINDNVDQEGLFNMYTRFLSWDMGIDKMGLFIPNGDAWTCASCINIESDQRKQAIIPHLLEHKRLKTIKNGEIPELDGFDIIIPVYHKKHAIAYAVIGGIKEKEDLYNKIEFITTITNIIAVAIENKRLFKQQIEQERLNKELEVASDVQKMLIPDVLPTKDRYELASIYKPHSSIGGDYFDYIPFSEDRFAFCIADISGKGVAAALLMANFQAIIQSLIYQYRDLGTFVFALNQSVHRITKSDKFITFFIAEVDLTKMTLNYINAGHFPPVLYNNKEITRLDKGCTVIGAFEKLPEIEETKIDLEHEALILTFTDGLADLQNSDGAYFDDDKTENFVKDNADLSVKDFNDRLLTEINTFRGEEDYSDDIAVLTCKIYK